jgi:DNA-nicking Smr family endonuclease
MKPRAPTAEELRLWRESNRFTKKILAEVEAEHNEEISPSPIGERTGGWHRLTPPRLDNALTPTLPLGGRELSPLPIREAAKRFKTHPSIEATLDLHGLSKLEAYAAVSRFVARERRKGRRHVLIITGKGREGEGILRRELPHWLNEPALRAHLSAFAHAHPTRGGAGVMHVLLKKYCD